MPVEEAEGLGASAVRSAGTGTVLIAGRGSRGDSLGIDLGARYQNAAPRMTMPGTSQDGSLAVRLLGAADSLAGSGRDVGVGVDMGTLILWTAQMAPDVVAERFAAAGSTLPGCGGSAPTREDGFDGAVSVAALGVAAAVGVVS